MPGPSDTAVIIAGGGSDEGDGGRRQGVVVRRVAHVLALKEHVYLAEGRPQRVVTLPTLAHEVVDLARTSGRLRQLHGRRGGGSAPRRHVVETTVVNHLLVVEPPEGPRAGETEHLPQRHGERPDVTLRRELALRTGTAAFSHRISQHDTIR